MSDDELFGIFMGADGAVDPGDIASTEVWYAAYKETSYSDGDNANAITDFSGNGFDLDATGHAPTYETNELNGHPIFRFVGTDYAAASTASDWKFLHDGTDYIVFSVLRDTINNGTRTIIIGATAFSTAHVGFLFMWDDRSALPRTDALVVEIDKGSAGNSIIQGAMDNIVDPANFNICEADYDFGRTGDDMIVRVDGVDKFSAESTNLPHSSANPDYPFWIGSLYQAAFLSDSDVAEIIILKEPVGTDIADIRNYLSTKYNISV